MTDSITHEVILKALFENYESIYAIDAETNTYQCYYESEPYSGLRIASSGEDFFSALKVFVPKVIHPEDQEYVLSKLQKETVLSALKKEKYYSFVYRLAEKEKHVYHRIRGTLEHIKDRVHILLGVRNVDDTIRQELEHMDTIASMHQKEKNHMEAILASAAGYLEVNLTKDIVLEMTPYLPSGNRETAVDIPKDESMAQYSRLHQWLCENQITENRKRYERVGSREYLLACFTRGEKRASVSFSSRRKHAVDQPCREVFYLYQDSASGNVMAFCVIYDLTEQQRKEKELRDLENQLQISRIRNFTSQMQPHFLYNALGAIQEIVLENPRYAADLLGDFTIHLRSCIRSMANDRPLPFVQELENIRAYTNIEKMRFGEKLKICYEIETDRFSILPLSIQPLVENAIRHGIYGRGRSGGTVTVRSRETDDCWIVEVEDDGTGFDVEAYEKEMAGGKRDSAGLRSIIFRLEKVMHGHVNIFSTPGVGTKVTVSIPKGEETA